jgi:hypothetical protein
MKLQVQLIFNEKKYSLELNSEVAAKVGKLLKSYALIIQGKPSPMLELEGNTLWSSGAVEIEATTEKVTALIDELFKVIGMNEANLCLDVYNVTDSVGQVTKYKKSGITKEAY